MDTDLIAKYDLLLTPGFLDLSTCQQIIEETQSSCSVPATVYGRTDSGSVDQRVRKASRLTPSSETVELVNRRLLAHKPAVERHFQVSLRDVEEPQFLRYQVGDFFVAHQDGNTGLIQLKTESDRKISVVVFLNLQTPEPASGTFCGGALKFLDYRADPGQREFELLAQPGLMVAFRSELTHEVLQVTHGERYTIVSWYK